MFSACASKIVCIVSSSAFGDLPKEEKEKIGKNCHSKKGKRRKKEKYLPGFSTIRLRVTQSFFGSIVYCFKKLQRISDFLIFGYMYIDVVVILGQSRTDLWMKTQGPPSHKRSRKDAA